MEGQREVITRQQKLQGDTVSADTAREARETEVESKVHKYMVELADKRKQAGIISTPSSELLEAERRLAEVCVRVCVCEKRHEVVIIHVCRLWQKEKIWRIRKHENTD